MSRTTDCNAIVPLTLLLLERLASPDGGESGATDAAPVKTLVISANRTLTLITIGIHVCLKKYIGFLRHVLLELALNGCQ